MTASISQPARPSYEFGPFLLDTCDRVLLRDGQLVLLTPKTFETLLALVESGGGIVDKERLLRKIWPDTFVEEGNLAKKISVLRKTLGEDSTQHYIETIPRRGYRFVAEVREVRNGQISSNLETEQPPSQNGSSAGAVLETTASRPAAYQRPGPLRQLSPVSRLRWAATLLVIVLVTGFIVWRLALRATPEVAKPPLNAIPLTSFRGSETQVAFSPEGDRIAFVWNGPQGNNPDIYIKMIGAETPLRLTTSPAADTKPVWSPDGRYIAFLRQDTDASAFYLIPALGGAERKLANIFPYQVPSPGASPYYSPDGKYLAIPDKHSLAEPMVIFLLSVENGDKQEITSPPAGTVGDHYPAFSPDGKMLAFVRAESLSTDDIYLLPLSGREPRRLTFDGVPIAGLAWTADGREIIFSSRRTGSTIHLWRVAANGGRPERVETVGNGVVGPAVSLHGNRLAYTQDVDDINIWRIELDGTGRTKSQTEVIASTFWDHGPDYSPDGQRIVFASARSGGDGIWICESDGSKPRLLIDCGPYVSGTPRWSPDGRWIAFDSRSKALGTAGNPDIFIISVDGGQPQRLTADPAEDVAPSWSRDGRWIYFGSSRSGSMQIWRVAVAGGPAVQITTQGGFEGFESPDGKYFYYTKGRGIPGICRVPVEGGQEVPVIESHQAGAMAILASR